jgi:hypothetical protein
MASRTPIETGIPMSEQHEFLDLAKNFNWEEVGRRINAKPAIVGVQPCRRWSALHQAAFSGDAKAVQLLLDWKAPIDAQTLDGKTPRAVAEEKKNASVISVLDRFIDGGSKGALTPFCIGKKASKCGAMKAMKMAKGAMKAMKAMTVTQSKIAKGKRGKVLVYQGKFDKTTGGLKKAQLTKNKAGKIVSKRLQAHGKKHKGNIQRWVKAFSEARRELGLTGFVAIKTGSPLYEKTKAIYNSSQ